MYSFPTTEEWSRIAHQLDYSKLNLNPEGIHKPIGGFPDFLLNFNILNWATHLTNRIGDVFKCHVFIVYYYGSGFPDDQWYQIPGKNGQAVSYFDAFTEGDFLRKDMFDLFVNSFIFNVFSVLDTIGQILNIQYDCGFEIYDVTFKRVIAKLKDLNPLLHQALNTILESETYSELNKFRNEITHQMLPGSIGKMVEKFPNKKGMALTIGQYVPSKNVMEKIDLALDVLKQCISALSQTSRNTSTLQNDVF